MQEPGDDITGDSVDTCPSSLTSLLLEPGEVRIQLGHCHDSDPATSEQPELGETMIESDTPVASAPQLPTFKSVLNGAKLIES